MSTENLPKCAVLYSFCIYDLDEHEKRKLPMLRNILDMKLEAGDYTIDMEKMCHYLSVPELIARTMINHIETHVYGRRKFVILNGKEEWKTQDEIRASQIPEE
jgi:hypothetical protein